VTPRVLILGGTRDAAELAERLVQTFGNRLDVVTSLAGRTTARRALPGRVRVGGFGGVLGLIEYISAERIAVLIDATHPFAADISAHAVEAAEATHIPRLILTRPPWTSASGDRWIEADTLSAAADIVRNAPDFKRVFLAVGSGGLAPFETIAQRFFLVRVAEAPAQPPPFAGGALVVDRGPFSEANEIALFKAHEIDAVVSKNAGGSATYAKIAAARALGIPVVMVKRPAAPVGATTHAVDDAVRWVAGEVGLAVPAAS
jgi:precorrin-6A/cobalt-precorrin-6A reductase